MFTGIVREVGRVERLARRPGVLRLTVRAPRTVRRLRRGDSIAINGVCVSAVRVGRSVFTCEIIPETQRRTTLAGLHPRDPVNVESSLRATDRLDGHVVLGHVDGVGRIARAQQDRGERVLEIRVPRSVGAWLVPKGPIAVDGVSLTVGVRCTPSRFSVHLIPETLRQTTLGDRRVGDPVNIEIDYFAKLWRHRCSVGSRHQ